MILTSCGSEKISVILSNPCSPPCLYGITPGISKFDETVDLLIDVPGIKNKKETIEEYLKNNRVLSLFGVREMGLRVFLPDETVNNIVIITKNWKLREIFEEFGKPKDYLSYYQKFERTSRSVILLYPKYGLLVSVLVSEYNEKTDNSIIFDYSDVEFIEFISKESFYSYLDLNIMGYENEFFMDNIEPWQGVGELITTEYSF